MESLVILNFKDILLKFLEFTRTLCTLWQIVELIVVHRNGKKSFTLINSTFSRRFLLAQFIMEQRRMVAARVIQFEQEETRIDEVD